VSLADRLAERGEIGGRTVRITADGDIQCHVYPLGALPPGMVRVRTELSVISPGTEMTYVGRDASNPYLHKTWDPELRLFTSGAPTQQGEAAGLFLGDEFHHNGVEVRSGQIGNLHPRWEIGALRSFGVDLARRHALARPAEVLQVALSYRDA